MGSGSEHLQELIAIVKGLRFFGLEFIRICLNPAWTVPAAVSEGFAYNVLFLMRVISPGLRQNGLASAIVAA